MLVSLKFICDRCGTICIAAHKVDVEVGLCDACFREVREGYYGEHDIQSSETDLLESGRGLPE